jgi:hypothetical protein
MIRALSVARSEYRTKSSTHSKPVSAIFSECRQRQVMVTAPFCRVQKLKLDRTSFENLKSARIATADKKALAIARGAARAKG